MQISGELLSSGKNYFQPTSYGSGWYGANAAERYIQAQKNKLTLQDNNPVNIRYSPQTEADSFVRPNLNLEYVNNLLAFTKTHITHIAGPKATGLNLEQFRQLNAEGDSKEGKEQSIQTAMANLKADMLAKNSKRKKPEFTNEQLEGLFKTDMSDRLFNRLRPLFEYRYDKFQKEFEARETQNFKRLDRNRNGQLDLAELAALFRFSDGAKQYIQAFDPTFFKQGLIKRALKRIKHRFADALRILSGKPKELDNTTAIDGNISFLETAMTGLFLKEGSPKTLGQITSHIIKELNLKQAARQFEASHPVK